MNKKKIFTTILFVLVMLSVVVVISERKTHFISKFVDNVIMDNKNHYLSCDQLPSIEQVDKVVKEHKDVVEQIIKDVGKRYHDSEVTPIWKENTVTDGESFYVSFSWGESYPDCQNTGKGDIEIMYSVHQDRIIIEKIINEYRFFGIPYRLRNI